MQSRCLMPLTSKEFADLRNRLFRERVLPHLSSIGFRKCPMGKPYWGAEPHGGYRYDLCRINKPKIVEFLTVHMIKKDRGYQIIYYQVAIRQPIEDGDLNQIDDLPFRLPPATATEMRVPPERWIGNLSWPKPFEISFLRLKTGIGVEKAVEATVSRIVSEIQRFELYVEYWEATYDPIEFEIQNGVPSLAHEVP